MPQTRTIDESKLDYDLLDKYPNLNKEDLKEGALHEFREHDLSWEEAIAAAVDHMTERPDYYKALEKAGLTAVYPRNEEHVQTSIPPGQKESDMINPVNVGGKDNNFFKSDEPISGKIGGQFAEGTSAYNPIVYPNHNITVDKDAAIISDGATTTASPGIGDMQPTQFVVHRHKSKDRTHLSLRLSDGKSLVSFSLAGVKDHKEDSSNEPTGVKLLAFLKSNSDMSWLNFTGPVKEGEDESIIEEEDRGPCKLGSCSADLIELFLEGKKYIGRYVLRKTASSGDRPVYLFWKPEDQTPSSEREKLEASELSDFTLSRVMIAKKGDSEIRAKDVLLLNGGDKFSISTSSVELPSMATLGDLVPIPGTDYVGKTEEVDFGKAKVISRGNETVIELRGERAKGFFSLKKDGSTWSMSTIDTPDKVYERELENTGMCLVSASMRQVKLSLAGDNIIEGVAVTEGLHNREIYPWDELKKSYMGLYGAPLSYGHAGFIVGKVVDVWLDEPGRAIRFKAQIDNPMVLLMVKQGVFDSVSIGALAYKIPNEEGIIERRNLNFKELSIVPNPGCKLARFKLTNAGGYAS
jgi:hypothetical protein